jgi:hypothetical protein
VLLHCRLMAGKLRHRVRTDRDNPGHARLTSMTDNPIMQGTFAQIEAHLSKELSAKAPQKAAPQAKEKSPAKSKGGPAVKAEPQAHESYKTPSQIDERLRRDRFW